ncbi:hypothetical protein K450DRAFT_245291 [Umbelopsis ramanniana AG]|uniref:Uncharacterized protein n=1 Tax=Umbelopsis ramanniana AG TaxID=1314678 RepID=A0AAD5E7A0_UMBRA|nr:uncharacterized protein K450DRAFT_245291 [Umbelopsis ramanniana AG]KAI8578743.1 hypothetical protein K450DRAFT_245291 [Umbelopsis ramanniana AG]
MTDPSHSEDSCWHPYPNYRTDHSNGTVTYHFNPTAKHSLVRKHVVSRIQTAKLQSHKPPSTSPLSLKTLHISSIHSGGLPSPPVDNDHDHTHNFPNHEDSHLVVSPTPTPTEETSKDNRFASELVAHALQRLSDNQACSKDVDPHNVTSGEQEDESDIDLPNAQDLRQKIADLTAEKHRLFQLMKSKMQQDIEHDDDDTACQRGLTPVSEVTVCSNPSENEKENTERPNQRSPQPAAASSSKPTSTSSTSTERPSMYRSRPLSDRGYYHHQFHAPPSHHHLPPRSMYGAPSYRGRRDGYFPRPPSMRPSPYGPPSPYRRRSPVLDRRPRY